jgi:hypothetical protein
MTKAQLRKVLKEIGYNCSFTIGHSPFSDKTVTFVSMILPDGNKVSVSSASVFGKGFYDEHRKAFDLINEWRGKL